MFTPWQQTLVVAAWIGLILGVTGMMFLLFNRVRQRRKKGGRGFPAQSDTSEKPKS